MTLKEKLKKVPLQTRLQLIEEIRKRRGLAYLNEAAYYTVGGMIAYSDTRQGLDYWHTRSEKIDKLLNK